jgi:hypothetical protein
VERGKGNSIVIYNKKGKISGILDDNV